MRSWKTAKTPQERVFLYFRAHPETHFTTDHVASQIKVGRHHCREIIQALEKLGKLQSIEAVMSLRWGRPKVLFRAVRTTEDSLRQLEAFTDALAESDVGGIYASMEHRRRAS